jgi:predicted nucleic acid-binding protein
MSFLCDTNVLSELCRPRPDAGVVAWADGLTQITLSAVTLEEVCYGLAWRPKPKILAWFESFLGEHCEVLPVSPQVARRAGEMRGALAARGAPRTQADMLLAATAQLHRLTLVTRNVRDFDGCGIPVLDPWSRTA